MKKVFLHIALILFVIAGWSNLNAQTCGFGCLGLSGVYGGYTNQNYDASNLTEYLISNYSNNVDVPKFGNGGGVKFGSNIFRAKFDGFFISAKGFYQFLEEGYNIEINDGSLEKEKYQLETNYFGFALDFGVDVIDLLSFKLVEGGITFHDSELRVTSTFVDNSVQDATLKYTNDKLSFGFYAGSGFILHVVQDYVSIEGTAFYSFYKLNNLSRESNTNNLVYLLPDDQNTISSGGFGASIQLNVGFPF